MHYAHLPALFRRALIVLPGMTLVVACAAPSLQTDLQAAESPSAIAAPVAPSATVETRRSFAQWRADFRTEALAAGISPLVFDEAFASVTPDPAIIEADRSQPEFTRPIWEYLDSALSSQRVATGRQLLHRQADVLQRIEARYGVDRHVLVAIWGLESNFGRMMGNKSVIRSLATLAHEGRRPDFAHDQLLAALRILQHGDVRAARMQGSWAGAMGQTQFIPSTYLEHAVDFDGDGRRDIWDSSADALASAANYLQQSGWQPGQDWGHEVTLPQGFDYALADPAIRQPLQAWAELGLAGVPERERQRLASLLLPAGHRGPAFLVMDNFRSVLRYNNASSYALAINLLAERFRGGGEIVADWPRSDRPLSRSERIELQERLAGLGFDPGTADSIIGANTRRAIREYQQRLGWPADGYPTPRLLERLRDESMPRQSASR